MLYPLCRIANISAVLKSWDSVKPYYEFQARRTLLYYDWLLLPGRTAEVHNNASIITTVKPNIRDTCIPSRIHPDYASRKPTEGVWRGTQCWCLFCCGTLWKQSSLIRSPQTQPHLCLIVFADRRRQETSAVFTRTITRPPCSFALSPTRERMRQTVTHWNGQR